MPGFIEVRHGAKIVNVEHIVEAGEATEMYDMHILSYIVLSTGDVIPCEETLAYIKRKIKRAKGEKIDANIKN